MRLNTTVALMCAAFAFALPNRAAAASADCEGCTCYLGLFCDTGQVTMPMKCISYQGEQRCWHVHKPKGIGNKKVPLVVDMHGFSVPVYTNLVSGLVHGGGHYDISRWKEKANQNEFIVVYPVGTGFLPAWNAGNGCCGDGAKDDSGFIKKLIDWMKGGYSIDGDRVYLAGHSNGCSLAQRVAIEHSSVVAGVACHAMYRLGGYSTPPSYNPRSVMEIHGTGDAVIPYSNYANWPHGASANIDAWAALNECQSKTSNPNLGNGMSDVKWNNCKDPAVSHRLLTLAGVDHFPYLGKGTMLDTTQEAWNFLKDLRMSKYGSAQTADATPGNPPPTPPTPPTPTKSDCTDLERPLDNLGLEDGEHIQWSCIEYKAYYGLGSTDACDPDVIAAHENCDEDCQANPGFINTRCPASCRTKTDPGTCSCDCYTPEYPGVNLFEGVKERDNSCQEDFQNSGFEKYDSCCMYGPSDGLCCTDLERPLDNLDYTVCSTPNARKADTTLVWPFQKDDKRNCGDVEKMVDSYCSKDQHPECYQHLVSMCCYPDGEGDGDGDGEGDGKGKGEHIEWSCAEYKAYYGLGSTDACDPDVIAAHENCDEDCQANPSFISTRCPISCQPTQPDTCTPSYECSAAEYDELITAYINRFAVECPKACSQAPLDYPDTLLSDKLPKCSNEDTPEWTTDSCGTAKCATYRASIEFKNGMELLDKCNGVGAGDGLKAALALDCATKAELTEKAAAVASGVEDVQVQYFKDPACNEPWAEPFYFSMKCEAKDLPWGPGVGFGGCNELGCGGCGGPNETDEDMANCEASLARALIDISGFDTVGGMTCVGSGPGESGECVQVLEYGLHGLEAYAKLEKLEQATRPTGDEAVLTGDAIRNLISSVMKLAGINEADSTALTDAVAGLTDDALNAFISGGAPDMSALLEDSTVKSALETAGVNVGLLASSLEVTGGIHDGSGAACTVLSATAMTFAAVNAAMLF